MFPAPYFGPRYFTGAYWPKVGATVVFLPGWTARVNVTVGWTIQPL